MNIKKTLISTLQRNKAGFKYPYMAIVLSYRPLRHLLFILYLFVLVSSVLAQSSFEVLEAVKPDLQQSKQQTNIQKKPVEKSKEQPWLESLARAYQQAQQKGKPIFVRLEGKSCPYCKILAGEIKKPIVQEELKRWTLVRLDVDKTPSAVQLLVVGPIPALRLLAPTGKVVESKDGVMSADNLVKWLQEHYNTAAVIPDKSLLASGPPDALTVIRLVKQFKQRDATLREAAIQRLIPYPDAAAALVVNAFSDGPLSSQLAALELLREWKAPVDGLDPWNPKSISLERLKKLSVWFSQSDHSKSISKKTELTPVELESSRKMISSLLSATPEEARAVRERLSRFGSLLLPEVTARLKTVETDQNRERLTALRYRLVAIDRLVLEWPGGIERLAATDVKVRQKAITELSKRATSKEEKLLLELFSDPAPLVREISLRTLKEVGGTSSNNALIRLLNDPEPNVRAAVLKQLAEKPSRSIVPDIAEYVEREKDPDLIVHAVRLFREAKGNASIEALMKLLSHPSWRVRAESAEAIAKAAGRYSSTKALHTDVYMALIELLQDEDSFVVSRAVAALSSADLVVAVEPLTKAASKHPDLASEVVKALSQGEKQRPKSIPYLREFCNHKQPEVRAAAITGLCSLIPSDVNNELRQSLIDPDSLVRTAAANAFFGLLASETIPHPISKSKPGFFESLFPETTSNPKNQKLNTPARHTEQYENSLVAIRNGKIRKKWMFELSPLLARMLNQESEEEQLAGARALAGLGRDKQAIPKLRSILKSHPEHISTITSVLPWLLWDDRIQLFQELSQSAQSTNDLHLAISRMANPRDHRALNAYWELLARKDVDAAFAYSIIRGFRKIYLNQTYYDFDDVSAAAKKRAITGMISRARSGPHWQRTVALVVLISLSREETEKLASTILSDNSTSAALRENVFQILLASQTKSQATKTALKGLAHKNPMLRRFSLAYLSVGPQAVSSIANKKLALESSFLKNSSSSQKSGIPILPEAPAGLDAKILVPMLNSNDPQTAAYAGYLLTLFDHPEGFSPLMSYWEESGKYDPQWTRLVYRSIAYSNDSSYVPLLGVIYDKHIEKKRYYRGNLKEFYWTIRIMSGPEIIALRKRIRDEVGMDQLR